MSKKINIWVLSAGAVVGIAAVALTALGNPANMGFCIACFLRDIAGATKLHSAAVVQYIRPEIIGLVLGSTIIALATGEFKPRAGSSPAVRFILGAIVMIGALVFLGCPLRMVIRMGGGDLNAFVGLVGFAIGILIGIFFLKRGFSLKRSYTATKAEGFALPFVMVALLALLLIAGLVQMQEWLRAVLILIGFLPVLFATPFMLRIEQTAGYYQCAHCGHRYVPSYQSVFMAMHMGRTRYMKCPSCQKRSWQKKVIRKD